jgi:hypothetical protein
MLGPAPVSPVYSSRTELSLTYLCACRALVQARERQRDGESDDEAASPWRAGISGGGGDDGDDGGGRVCVLWSAGAGDSPTPSREDDPGGEGQRDGASPAFGFPPGVISPRASVPVASSSVASPAAATAPSTSCPATVAAAASAPGAFPGRDEELEEQGEEEEEEVGGGGAAKEVEEDEEVGARVAGSEEAGLERAGWQAGWTAEDLGAGEGAAGGSATLAAAREASAGAAAPAPRTRASALPTAPADNTLAIAAASAGRGRAPGASARFATSSIPAPVHEIQGWAVRIDRFTTRSESASGFVSAWN